MTSNSQNISSAITAGSDAAVGGGGNWLGARFSLSPDMEGAVATMESGADGCRGFLAHQHHGGSLCYPPALSSASAPSYTFGGGGGLASGGAGGGFYHPGLSSMPLNTDGSLCIVEALHRSYQERHGMVSSASPKLEDFLGASTAMALSLDGSSFYYGGHGHDQGGGYLRPLQVAPGSDGHALYGGHAHLVDQSAARVVVGGGGYDDVTGASAIVPFQQDHPHPLAISMSGGTGSQCSNTMQAGADDGHGSKKGGGGQKQVAIHGKSIKTFGQRSSKYRGVSKHRWTARYEAHLWDNTYRREGQSRKGRQVYLGGYDMEDMAARAYDLAALKYWGNNATLNFSIEEYVEELKLMKNMTRLEFVAHLRRTSSGFSRGASIYRGVTRHHKDGRWQARIGRVAGNRDLYLGTFSTQEAAAEAYDVAAIKFRGRGAVTNFEMTRYDIDKIESSKTLFPGRNKDGAAGALAVCSVADDAVASAAPAMQSAGSCVVPDTSKIQAALPAAAVERGGSGGQDHQDLLSGDAFSLAAVEPPRDGGVQQHQHEDYLLSSEVRLLHDICVDAPMSNASWLAPSASNSQ